MNKSLMVVLLANAPSKGENEMKMQNVYQVFKPLICNLDVKPGFVILKTS